MLFTRRNIHSFMKACRKKPGRLASQLLANCKVPKEIMEPLIQAGWIQLGRSERGAITVFPTEKAFKTPLAYDARISDARSLKTDTRIHSVFIHQGVLCHWNGHTVRPLARLPDLERWSPGDVIKTPVEDSAPQTEKLCEDAKPKADIDPYALTPEEEAQFERDRLAEKEMLRRKYGDG